jgi:exodeoxyribonuclease VII small subunit
MQEKKINYEEAILQLENIARRMENGEFEMDELVTQLKKAQELIKLCNDKLRSTDEEVKKILGQDGQ